MLVSYIFKGAGWFWCRVARRHYFRRRDSVTYIPLVDLFIGSGFAPEAIRALDGDLEIGLKAMFRAIIAC
ncbi:hypothetical protein FE257_000665, partial [Aspergillus nanangensis]